MSLDVIVPITLLVIAVLANWWCVSVGVASIILKHRTHEAFLKRDNQIEIALLTHASSINFWVKVVLWIELFITIIIGHYVSISQTS
jgi:uncharacterized membrane protein